MNQDDGVQFFCLCLEEMDGFIGASSAVMSAQMWSVAVRKQLCQKIKAFRLKGPSIYRLSAMVMRYESQPK